jgi:uncharacterized protein with PIN domain
MFKAQDCENIYRILSEHSISPKEFIEWVKERSKTYGVIDVLDPRCPKCRNRLVLREIKRENENGFKSMWRCKSCQGFEQGNKESVNEIMER